MVAAVGAALDNVRRHCGEDARAWVFAEHDGDTVTITVRDEGPGIPAGRLEEAETEGRLGIAQSIKGRIAGCRRHRRLHVRARPGDRGRIRHPRPHVNPGLQLRHDQRTAGDGGGRPSDVAGRGRPRP
ncbi:ATP-binding protein [Nonomuraea ferruginea]